MTAAQHPLTPPPPDEYDAAGPPPEWDLGNLPAGQHPNDRYYQPGDRPLPAARQDRDDWADIVGHGHQGTHHHTRPGDSLGRGLLFTDAVSPQDWPGDPAIYTMLARQDDRIRNRQLHRLPPQENHR